MSGIEGGGRSNQSKVGMWEKLRQLGGASDEGPEGPADPEFRKKMINAGKLAVGVVAAATVPSILSQAEAQEQKTAEQMWQSIEGMNQRVAQMGQAPFLRSLGTLSARDVGGENYDLTHQAEATRYRERAVAFRNFTTHAGELHIHGEAAYKRFQSARGRLRHLDELKAPPAEKVAVARELMSAETALRKVDTDSEALEKRAEQEFAELKKIYEEVEARKRQRQ